jgi:hypothetical protein
MPQIWTVSFHERQTAFRVLVAEHVNGGAILGRGSDGIVLSRAA